MACDAVPGVHQPRIDKYCRADLCLLFVDRDTVHQPFANTQRVDQQIRQPVAENRHFDFHRSRLRFGITSVGAQWHSLSVSGISTPLRSQCRTIVAVFCRFL